MDLDGAGGRRRGADEAVALARARYGQIGGGRDGAGRRRADPGVGHDGRCCGCRGGACGQREPYESAEERKHGSSSLVLDSHPTVSTPEAPARELFARLPRIAPEEECCAWTKPIQGRMTESTRVCSPRSWPASSNRSSSSTGAGTTTSIGSRSRWRSRAASRKT